MLSLEPEEQDTGLLGIELEPAEGLGLVRHWFDIDPEAGLIVDMDGIGSLGQFIMSFNERGEELVHAL